MKYLIYLFLVVCLIASCKKELPFPNTENNDFIVMNGLIDFDKGVNVHLSQTCHVTETACDQNNLENAQVFLKDGSGNTLVELTHLERGVYTADGFQIEHNTAYAIEASSAGLETITAKTNTPKPLSCTLIDMDEEIYQTYLCRTFKIEIEDDPNETNYYLIDGWVDILNGEHQNYENEYYLYTTPHTGFLTRDLNAENAAMLSRIGLVPLPLEYIFLTDENFNGESYQLEFGLYEEDLIWDSNFELEAHINVKSVTKDLYDYYKSITLYKLTAENPLSEPQQIFSNIEKGVGIFSGYSQHEFIETLPQTGFWFNSSFSTENEGCTGPCTIKFYSDVGDKITPQWDFGDGNTSDERNPEHEYQSSGMYQVVLSVETGSSGFATSRPVEIN